MIIENKSLAAESTATPSIKSNAEFFRNFFAPIPDEKWTIEERDDKNGRHCALGLLELEYGSLYFSINNQSQIMLKKVRDTFINLKKSLLHNTGDWVLAHINNGSHPDYKQETPKERVLAACDDLIAGRY